MNTLEGLIVGDVILVVSHYGRKQLFKITRTTKTQVLVGEARYRKSDGAALGSGPHTDFYVRPATPEDIEIAKAASRRSFLVKAINGADIQALPIETLELVFSALCRLTGGEK